MNRDRADSICELTNKIRNCEGFLGSLKGRSYNDEFTIYYRGNETCELEEECLNILIEHYEKKLDGLNQQLSKL